MSGYCQLGCDTIVICHDGAAVPILLLLTPAETWRGGQRAGRQPHPLLLAPRKSSRPQEEPRGVGPRLCEEHPPARPIARAAFEARLWLLPARGARDRPQRAGQGGTTRRTWGPGSGAAAAGGRPHPHGRERAFCFPDPSWKLGDNVQKYGRILNWESKTSYLDR